MSSIVKDILTSPIQMADQISKLAGESKHFRQECHELKSKTEKLAGLLRQAARNSNDLYERPTRRIIAYTEQALDKALKLVSKCRANSSFKRIFTLIPAAAFRKTSMQLENSLGDVQWLLRVSASMEDRDDQYLGLPPIASSEPILCLIWEQVAILLSGYSVEERSDAAASLVSLARDNDRYGKLIMEEGGVPPLLKLLKEGKFEGQENAARAIGLLGRDPESAEHIVNAGVCSVFAKILKECPHMKVQAVVAWAISELAKHHPKCQDHFAQNNVIRLLVSHLAFETIEEHSKYVIANRQQNMSIDSVLMASSEEETNNVKQNHQSQGRNGMTMKGKEIVADSATKAEMKAMAARALWQLCKGNLTICRNITESRAILCFAVLFEKGAKDVRSYSVMALMEIAAMAEQHSELRRSAFKPTSPAAKAVVEQFLKVIEKGGSEEESSEFDADDFLIPCIQAVGYLAKTFRATETRLIEPLVKLLDEKELEVSTQAAIALIKFACSDNYLHEAHCSAIIHAGGAKHLIQLVYFGEHKVQVPSVMLLCYIAMHVPKSETLAREEVIMVLEWCSKQAHLVGDPSIQALLPEARSKLELYQSRGVRGFH